MCFVRGANFPTGEEFYLHLKESLTYAIEVRVVNVGTVFRLAMKKETIFVDVIVERLLVFVGVNIAVQLTPFLTFLGGQSRISVDHECWSAL
jgi:hypothetical protein